MPLPNIHPTAIVEQGASLGDNVVIEPYAIVKKNVTLSDGVVVMAHAYIDGHTTIGPHTIIYPSAIIGTRTQDLKFRGEKTYVHIGAHCQIREFVTINSSCQEDTVVQVGDNCLIMAYCHIAHNCTVEEGVIMSNNATLAGHVTVGKYAVIGGLTPIHQFSDIGCYAMVGGMSRVTHSVPPYTVGAGIPYKVGGLNIVGLKRHGFPTATRHALSRAFKLIYRSNIPLKEALEKIAAEIPPLPEIQHFIAFCRSSKRGLIGLQSAVRTVQDGHEEADEEASALSLAT